MGRKYGEEKERLFRESDIFVFPTYYDNECFPLVLLEAMQYGLPCVTTDEGGIRDIVVNDSGFTVHSTPYGVLAEKTADAVLKLINNNALRRQMGITGRNRVIAKFSDVIFEEGIKKILEINA